MAWTRRLGRSVSPSSAPSRPSTRGRACAPLKGAGPAPDCRAESAIVHETEVAALAALVEAPNDCLFMSGSRLEGLGNAHSDWDYFLVLDAPDTRTGGIEAFAAGNYLDCEVLARSQLVGLSSRLAAAAKDTSALRGLAHTDLDLYYRLLIGEPTCNAKGFAALQAHFDRQLFVNAYERWAFHKARPMVRLAAVSLGSDDTFAALAAREAAVWLTEAMLCRNGEAYPNTKWWHEKAVRAYGAGSERARALWQLHNIGTASIDSYVRTVLDLAAGMFEFRVAPACHEDPSVPRPPEMSEVQGQLCLLTRDAMLLLPPHTASVVTHAMDINAARAPAADVLTQSWAHLLTRVGVIPR